MTVWDRRRVTLVDTAGEGDYAQLRKSAAYRNASCIVVCVASTAPAALPLVEKAWLPELHDGAPGVPVVLACTKSEQRRASAPADPTAAATASSSTSSSSRSRFSRRKAAAAAAEGAAAAVRAAVVLFRDIVAVAERNHCVYGAADVSARTGRGLAALRALVLAACAVAPAPHVPPTPSASRGGVRAAGAWFGRLLGVGSSSSSGNARATPEEELARLPATCGTLPREAWLALAQRCDVRTVGRLAQTCRALQQLCANDLVWQHRALEIDPAALVPPAPQQPPRPCRETVRLAGIALWWNPKLPSLYDPPEGTPPDAAAPAAAATGEETALAATAAADS